VVAGVPYPQRRPKVKGLEMEGKHFDQLIKSLGAGVGRRHLLGGVIGTTAALLTGAAVLRAKPGGNGNGQGKGRQKVTICHYQGTKDDGTPKYKALKLGAPGAANHLKHHEEDTPFVDCCPGDLCEPEECFTAASCVEGECTSTTPAGPGTVCTTEGGLPGECDGLGTCVETVPIP
jgi:hypothetical protein